MLPLYFKHSKFPSFVRQLNMYDFHKTRVKSVEKEFTHQYFRKGDPELLRHIKRKTVSEESQEGHTSKLKTLTNRFNELQSHCKNLEKIAELSIPIKKLKTDISKEESGLLFQGITAFIDSSHEDSQLKTIMNKVTESYIEALRNLKRDFDNGCLQGPDAYKLAGEPVLKHEASAECVLGKRTISCGACNTDSSMQYLICCHDNTNSQTATRSHASEEFEDSLFDFNACSELASVCGSEHTNYQEFELGEILD